MALEIKDINPAVITAYVDETDTLRFRHTTTELDPHENQVIAVTADRMICFELPQFSDWTLTATHMDEDDNVVTWTTNRDNVSYSFGCSMTDFLEITVGATKPGMSTATKKLYIQAKPKTSLPDRP